MRSLVLCAALAACSSKPAAEAPTNQTPPPASAPEPAAPEPVRLIFDPLEGSLDGGAIDTIRRRLGDMKLSDPLVISGADGSVAVELAPADLERAPEVIRAVVTPGELGLHVVDSGSAEMKRLYADVSRRATAEVTGEIDTWVDHQGKRYSDWHIEGATRGAVAAAFDGIKVAGRELGLQRLDGDRWRSYWLETPAVLTHDSIAGAQMVFNPTTNQPEVLVELEPDGAKRFAEATARNLGKKIAIVLDGEVMTAPVVMAKITGGRISLSMGGADKEAAIEAGALARALRSGAIPPLKLRQPD